jgi:hypothetical protein
MKLIKTILFSAILITTFAFKNAPESEIFGTYGVSKSDPAKIGLTIKEDKTFSYRDYSVMNKIIEVQGTWELKNNKIILQGHTSKFPYGSKWRIEKEGKAVRTRKGLEFIRLAKF